MPVHRKRVGRVMVSNADGWAGGWVSQVDGWADPGSAMHMDGPVVGCPR